MIKLRLIVVGDAAQEGVDELREVLGGGSDVEQSTVAALPEADRKAVDPIALAALILSVPSAILAVADISDRISDRIAKRRKAKEVIATADRLRIEKRIETYVVTVDGPRSLNGISPDQLLELAGSDSPAD